MHVHVHEHAGMPGGTFRIGQSLHELSVRV